MSESHTHNLPSSSLPTYQDPNTSSPPRKLPTSCWSPCIMSCCHFMCILSFLIIIYHFLLLLFTSFSYLTTVSFSCTLSYCQYLNKQCSHLPCVSLLTVFPRPGVRLVSSLQECAVWAHHPYRTVRSRSIPGFDSTSSFCEAFELQFNDQFQA